MDATNTAGGKVLSAGNSEPRWQWKRNPQLNMDMIYDAQEPMWYMPSAAAQHMTIMQGHIDALQSRHAAVVALCKDWLRDEANLRTDKELAYGEEGQPPPTFGPNIRLGMELLTRHDAATAILRALGEPC